MSRIQVLVGIDEDYTREKIVDCFKYRSEYQVHTKTRSDQIAGNYDFYWLEYEDLDFESLLKTSDVLFNSYVIRKGLIRKAQIAFYIKKYISKHPTCYLARHVPPTYIFELDYIDYLDEALNEVFEVEQALAENLNKPVSKKFILKSSMTNKGAEMLIFDTKQQLEDYFQRRIDQSEDEMLDLREWVIQEYMANPLQLRSYNNRKFHLRVYVIAIGNLDVYVYSDILALFCRDTFVNPDKLSSDYQDIDLKCHITNTCYQLDQLDDNNNQQERKQVEEECVKRFWSLNLDESDPVKNRVKLDRVFDQIKHVVGELFDCLSCEPTVFQPVENAFELYGFDFLVDQDLNCSFLEANAFPDFKQTGDKLNDLIDCLFYQTISLACDTHFKVPRVCDPDKMSLVFSKNNKRKP